MSTRIFIDATATATRNLGTIPYPNDITVLPSLISGLILQADFDATDTTSLIRNRVGSALTVGGSPVMSGYGVTLSESAYLDTGIDISAYNTSGMTMVAILGSRPTAQTAILGRIQFNAPQRSRGIQTSTTAWRGKWLTSTGAGQTADVTYGTDTTRSDIIAARFTYGSASMTTEIKNLYSATGNSVFAASAPYAISSATIKLGKSDDSAGTGSVVMRAALVFSKVLTDDELATLYLYYKNYYGLKGITI